MAYFLGIDTSNYTTSCAIFSDSDSSIVHKKRLLPVKQGQLGLRQSDAVFAHVKALPELISELFEQLPCEISAVAVSDRPCGTQDSYMPCFLPGVCTASSIASAMDIPLYRFSHQQGHLAAALYSGGAMHLLNERFIAFHVSGGTTQAVLVEPGDEILAVRQLSCSLDLKMGQAIDRLGVLLGYPFPAGKYVDELACKSEKRYKFKIKLNDGNCNISGLENKVKNMLDSGETPEDACRYCIDFCTATLQAMAEDLLKKHGALPLVFSGGVMSNSIIKDYFKQEYGAVFASPEFSSDNAAGTAILASIQEIKKGG